MAFSICRMTVSAICIFITPSILITPILLALEPFAIECSLNPASPPSGLNAATSIIVPNNNRFTRTDITKNIIKNIFQPDDFFRIVVGRGISLRELNFGFSGSSGGVIGGGVSIDSCEFSLFSGSLYVLSESIISPINMFQNRCLEHFKLLCIALCRNRHEAYSKIELF